MSNSDSGLVTVEITAKDRNGLVYDISGVLSEFNIPILHHEARVCSNKRYGMISKSRLDVKIESQNQWNMVMRRIKRIKGIINVNLSLLEK